MCYTCCYSSQSRLLFKNSFGIIVLFFMCSFNYCLTASFNHSFIFYPSYASIMRELKLPNTVAQSIITTHSKNENIKPMEILHKLEIQFKIDP